MADARFFSNQGPLTAAIIAEAAQCTLVDQALNGGRKIADVAPLDRASSEDLSFFDNPAYRLMFQESSAGFCIVAEKYRDIAPENMVLLLSDRPYHSYAMAAQMFYPVGGTVSETAISSAAHIAGTARLGTGCVIAPGVVIGANARLGDNCHVDANSVIGNNVEIGDNVRIGANASISHSLIGDNVLLYPGVRIGQEGFGFSPDASGHIKVPQLGLVIIEDNCEIGANTTIDRGSGQNTVIGRGTWIDNLVQIAHNVKLGKGCIIAAQVGIAGSTEVGDFAVFGGQAGIAGHISIGAGAQIGAQGGVTRDVPAGAKYSGTPSVPLKQYLRQATILAGLARRENTGDKKEDDND